MPEEPEVDSEPEVPPFTINDVKKLVAEEVKNRLKIKLKVPSKGKVISKEDLANRPESIKKNWYEVIV